MQQSQKKIKFDANKLNDPKPNWPKVSSPFSSDVLNYNQPIAQDSIIIEVGLQREDRENRAQFPLL